MTYIKKMIPFETWLRANGIGDIIALMSRSDKDKEKVFLTWKWGLPDMRAAKSMEATRRDIVEMVLHFGLEHYKGESKIFFGEMVAFENRCNSIRRDIGLPIRGMLVKEDRYEPTHVETMVKQYKD